jgi:hypothetical protein
VGPLVLGIALGAAAYWNRDLWIPTIIMGLTHAAPSPPAARDALGLNTIDLEGQLQIRWNRNAPAVQQAVNGILHITGADPSTQAIALDHNHLLSGVFTVTRQAERVDVSLSLTGLEGEPIREATAFVGKLPEAMPVSAEQDALEQVAKIRADLDAEIQRSREMQKSIDLLTKQLGAGKPSALKK